MSHTNNTPCKGDPNDAEHIVDRSEKLNKNLITRFNRVEGQIKGIKSMIDRDVYCDDILTQIAAVQSAISSASKLLLENHMQTCIADRLRQGDNDAIQEFIKTVGRLL